jgi:hypothetical protein
MRHQLWKAGLALIAALAAGLTTMGIRRAALVRTASPPGRPRPVRDAGRRDGQCDAPDRVTAAMKPAATERARDRELNVLWIIGVVLVYFLGSAAVLLTLV